MNKKQHLSNVVKTPPANSPWLMAQCDSATLIQIARDSQQQEKTRMMALEILGRRTDRNIEGKLALLSKKDKDLEIQNAASRALHRSRYMRSRQSSPMTKILESMI